MVDREHEVLEQARRGLAPSAADARRVRAGVAAAISGIGPGTPDPGAPGSAGEAVASSVVAKLVVAGAVAAAAALGYVAGHRAGVSEERARAVGASPVAAASSGAMAQLSPVPLPPAASALPQPIPGPAPRSAGSVVSPRPSVAPSAAASGRAAFDEEVIQLRRVQRALREGNARLALALLDDLDRAVPQGRLGEERAAAGVMARCALGVGPPSVVADDFAKRFPNSVYAARVQQACAANEQKK